MSPGDLNEITAGSYAASKIYRDDEYNLSGFFPWERAVVDRYFSGRRSVLVAACGGGREVIALARRGVLVDGFECNAGLLELAKRLVEREHLEAGIFPAPTDGVPAELGAYEAGVIGYGAYMHVAGRRNRIRFLDAFRGHLRPGSPLLLSFQLRGKSRRDALVAATARLLRRLRRDAVDAELGDMLSGPFEHWFTAEEVRAELDEAGFDLLHLERTVASHAVARAREGAVVSARNSGC